MAEFLTTHGTAFYLERIISEARERLVLVSPYLKVSRLLAERLHDADRSGVPLTLVYGKEELRDEERTALGRLSGLTAYFLPHLHAKCYANERHMVITSMNMYEFSEKTNREMGVLLAAAEPAYTDAMAEISSIIAAASPRHFATQERLRARTTPDSAGEEGGSVGAVPGVVGARVFPAPPRGRAVRGGHCIRCRGRVPANPARPLCDECYGVWAQFENAEYPERYCHACGREADTSVARPRCRGCYEAASSF
jgi:hypothetical protein